jgi:fructosamine-3-kinase
MRKYSLIRASSSRVNSASSLSISSTTDLSAAAGLASFITRRAMSSAAERRRASGESRGCLPAHGDLWAHNILAANDGRPASIDPAHLWCSPHPPEAKRFFDVYAELTGLDGGWRARMSLIQLRQHLAVIAQFDHDWGAAQQVRATLKPFRR